MRAARVGVGLRTVTGRWVCITGASSGIGAALARTAPPDVERILAVCRRRPPAGEHHAADLADPATWPALGRRFDAALCDRPSAAVLLHFAGTTDPVGPADAVASAQLRDALMLNAVAGPLLGSQFLAACAAASVPATVVLCSSPAASVARAGVAHYGAGKAALEHWVRAAADEQAGRPRPARVLAVVPWGVDTPMVRAAMEVDEETLPLAAVFRDRARRGELAEAQSTAREIWSLVDAADPPATVTAVGAVPVQPA
jgi:NAD(P)-dependent dehydrogenase (short-subunit alcohol dehydrogenase family)